MVAFLVPILIALLGGAASALGSFIFNKIVNKVEGKKGSGKKLYLKGGEIPQEIARMKMTPEKAIALLPQSMREQAINKLENAGIQVANQDKLVGSGKKKHAKKGFNVPKPLKGMGSDVMKSGSNKVKTLKL